jgi:thiaminase
VSLRSRVKMCQRRYRVIAEHAAAEEKRRYEAWIRTLSSNELRRLIEVKEAAIRDAKQNLESKP